VIVILLLLNLVSVLLDLFRVQVGHPSVIVPEYGGAGETGVNYGIAAVLLVIAVGLWLLKRWAWVATMLATGIGLANGIVMYAQGQPFYVGMVINVLIVLYLNQRAVQRAFEQRDATDAPVAPAGTAP
jgi:hypothetical protein